MTGRGRSAARQLVKKAALRAVAFVVARPRLDDFLRRQIYRFPGLAGRVRAAVAHSRRADWQSLPVMLSDEAELTDSARQVLHDLRRAIDHSRTP
jgi:hypothetical protein